MRGSPEQVPEGPGESRLICRRMGRHSRKSSASSVSDCEGKRPSRWRTVLVYDTRWADGADRRGKRDETQQGQRASLLLRWRERDNA